MRIVVTGGTGHTGARLARRLLGCGHDVTVLTRGGKSFVQAGLESAGAAIILGDLRRPWTLMEALSGSDVLIGCTHVRHAGLLGDACLTMGVQRYIQMSSTRRFTRWPCSTSQDVIAGEAALARCDLDYTIIRATMIFGGRRDANIERLVAWFRGRNWFPIFGDGRNLVQPVFVDDLIEAFVGALANPKGSARQSYTVGGPEPMAYESMLRSIAAACGRPAPWLPKVPLGIALAGAMVVGPILGRRGLTAEQIRRFGEDKTADISAAVRDLGFAPRSFDVAIQAKVAGLPDDL